MTRLAEHIERYFFHLHYWPLIGDTDDPYVHFVLEDTEALGKYWFLTAFDHRNNVAYGCEVSQRSKNWGVIDVRVLETSTRKIKSLPIAKGHKRVSELLR